MANIFWNEDRHQWRCDIQIDGIRKSFTSKKEGNAGKRAVKMKVDAFIGNTSYADRSLEKEWERFLSDVAARSSASNLRNIQQIGRLYILPKIGKKKMSTIRIPDLQYAINTSVKQDGTMLSKKMYSNIRGALSSFFHFARLDGVTDLQTSDLYIPRNAQKGTRNALSAEEVKRIFNEFEEEYYINLWRIMLCTGMRPSEAIGLRWEDIQGMQICIQRGINYHHELTDCKNTNARRAIPINSLIEEILEDQRKRTKDLNSPWIFPSPSGGMPYQSTAQHSIKRISDALGVNISAYCLRHTFVSLLKNDIPEAYMKQIIGHSTAMPTYHGTYAHDLTGEREKASSMIDDSLRKLI